MKKIILLSLVVLLILVLHGCGSIPFVTPEVEQSLEVPEGLEIELEQIINLELAQIKKGLRRYIPSDTTIGVWDSVDRIYTLTGDVNESIEITQNNLTLDGAGYKIAGSGTDIGVSLEQRSDVTVKNCVISEFSIGIYLSISSSNILTNNITHNNSYGIFLSSGSSNILTNNITQNNNYCGIYIISCSSNTLTKNTINNNQYGIKLFNCNLNKVYNNNFIDNSIQAHVKYGVDNEFFLDSLVGGNYWSNWTSPDGDGDYFVDYSYVFFDGRDNFPWYDL
jgi:parallel beta-helix repeat protein